MKHLFCTMALTFLLTISVHAKTEGDSIVPEEIPSVQPVIVLKAPGNIKSENIQYYVMVATDFQDTPVMIDVALAESTFDPHAKNPATPARGLFQIIDGTWQNYHCQGNPYKSEDNIACAKKIYAVDGTRDWVASKSKWG
jgi:hypothetical protein